MWNLTRLAETLLPLIDGDQDKAIKQAEEALGAFRLHFEAAYAGGLARKIGLLTQREGDFELTNDLLGRMAQHQVDFTLMFRRLCDAAADSAHDEPVRELFVDPTAFDEWAVKWQCATGGRGGQHVRARGHDARRQSDVHSPAITASQKPSPPPPPATSRTFETLVKVLSHPYDDQPDYAEYQKPPREDQIVQQTFCGT